VHLPRELKTDRLLLRRWVPADREPFAALNADPRVAEHLPASLSRQESDALAARIEAHFEEHGFGLWAVEVRGVAPFAGFTGLSNPAFQSHFTPCVEIGWRLAAPYWGNGYASEAARAALAFGFDRLGLGEIVSFTVPGNSRSRRVMQRIGMRHDPKDDFDHPALPEGHPLRRHVLYRIARPGAPRRADSDRSDEAGRDRRSGPARSRRRNRDGSLGGRAQQGPSPVHRRLGPRLSLRRALRSARAGRKGWAPPAA
jgi:RimJ/RimL family protein N-acetyltransferase